MITRRDKILSKPWEQKRYENHLRKIQNALPAIDNKPPVSREHVQVKLKCRQKEAERIAKIETENLLLLRKMNYIMHTNRVDNIWTKPLPNFLNRVTMYPKQRADILDFGTLLSTSSSPIECNNNDANANNLRKTKCSACTPHVISSSTDDKPEMRIPWDPPKLPWTPALDATNKRNIQTKSTDKSKSLEPQLRCGQATKIQPNSANVKSGRSNRPANTNLTETPNKVILTRGSLKLYINFPRDAQIKLSGTVKDKHLCARNCHCAALKRPKS